MFGTSHQVAEIFRLIYTYSYFILFPLVVIEGPIVTIIAGFLTAVGFLDFIPAYITIVAGDLAGDIIYYSAGRWWLNSTVNKIFSFFNVNINQVTKLEKGLKEHKALILFFGKLSHAIGGIILFTAGRAKIPMKDFVWFNFWATLPKSLILIGVGYYFGNTVSNFGKYLNFTVLGLFVFTLILIGIYFGITYLSNKLVARFEK